MSSDLSGGSGSLSNDRGPCACAGACACKPQTSTSQDLKPTETNGSAPSETRSDHFKSTNNDITTTTCPHESRDSTTLIDDDDSFSSSTINGSNINIDTPLANSHAEHPSYPEQDSLPSTPHSPPSTTNGVHNDANYQNDPELKDQSMPIAIVGIGCRFPGDATSPDKFWDLISEGRSAQGEFPKDRFNLDAFYHPSAERKGAINLRGGHFLKDDIALFDAPFFSITPNEAKSMDPQQRLLLEVAYESLENAGLRMEDIVGSQTSCYVGSFTKDYSELHERDPEDDPKYSATGTGSALLSNRISWFFDFKGPSLTLDTACSSSLVCLHLACQSLRTGESKMALVGGTSIIINPNMMVHLTALNFLSPDSKCQAFDHKANGYARGDGIASIVLKPLDDALRDNDVIRGVIRGTAVNQDGKTPGITNPSIQAQEDLINLAYESAGLDMSETSYFEAHGTGTQAGDPIESGALARTFGKTRTPENPLLVGTVKTNLGHLEGASGLAGLIKAVYVLEKGLIPPNLWFEKANPRIPFEQLKIKVPTELTPWPTQGLRRTSLNSFGYGGTNAHVIIEDAYNYLKSRGLKGNHNTFDSCSGSSKPSLKDLETVVRFENGTGSDTTVEDLIQDQYSAFSQDAKPPRLFVWSANEQSGIERQTRLYAEYFSESAHQYGEEILERLAYTLSCRRTVLPWKTFSVASSTDELRKALEQGLPKPVRTSAAPKLAFIFTGQGAQWYAMGRELLCNEIFSSSIQEADMYLKSLGCSWSLVEELCRGQKTSNINQAVYSQPICTALQVALVDLLDDWNIKPVAVVGHSSGEIAAAYCKGAISRQSAWKISYERGRLTARIKELAPHLQGAMLAAGIGDHQALEYLQRVSDGEVVIACVNSPSSVTMSGDANGIDQLHELLTADSIFSRKLKVENAYHSPHMQVIASAYLESLQDITTLKSTPSDVVMFSSVSGDIVNSEDLGPSYWVKNMTSTVEFSNAVQKLQDFAFGAKRRRRDDKSFVEFLVEVGPHAALQGPLKQITDLSESRKSKVSYMSLLSRGSGAFKSTLEAIGQLYIKGFPVDLWEVNNSQCRYKKAPALLTNLPSYPWSRTSRYWYESHLSTGYRFRKHPRLDLLGAPTPDYNPLEPKWRNFIRKSENPWILDHKVQSSVIYPAAGSIIMAVEAMRQIASDDRRIKGYELRDVKFEKAMMIPQDEEGIETTIQMRPWKIGSRASTFACREFSIFSMRPGQEWEENCSGLIMIHYEPLSLTSNETFEENTRHEKYQKQYQDIGESCRDIEVPRQLYESLETIGLQYGPTFRNLVDLKSGDHKSVGRIRIPDTKAVMPIKFEYPHVIHPATLDNVFQLALPALTGRKEPLRVPMLPLFLESLFISSDLSSTPGDELHGYATAERSGYREADSTIVLWNQNGTTRPTVVAQGFRCIALSAMTSGNSSSESRSSARDLCFQLCWKEDTDLITPEQAKTVFGKAADNIQHVEPITIQELEIATLVYIQRALKAFPPESAGDFPSHLKLMYSWMQQHHALAIQGSLGHQDGTFDWLKIDPDYEKELLLRVAEQSVDGKLLCRLGQHLEPMFKREIETLQVMLEDDLLYDFYKYGVGSREMNAQVAEYMDRVAHKRPDIKILEVGGGTGGTSLPVLQMLGGQQGSSPRFSSYTFTDVSSGFFEKAAEKLKEWRPYLIFQKLNIEEDPSLQGFELGTFDIVIASNVLHVSHSIDKTLANVKTLLKPGGKLVLGEITHMLGRGMFMFGWLPGWWIGNDDGRELGPILTEPQWNKALIRQQFSGIDFCVHDFKESKDHMLSVIVSTAASREPPIASQNVLIVKPAISNVEVDALSNKLIDRLSVVGCPTTSLRLRDLTDFAVKDKMCIVLADVDHPLLPGIDQDAFEAVRNLVLQSAGVLWLSKGGAVNSPIPEGNWFVGLSRSIRAEHAGVTLVTLDLESNSSIAAEDTVDAILRLLASVSTQAAGKQQDCEFALRDGIVSTCRIIAQKETNEMLADQNQAPTPTLLPFNQPGRPLKLEVGVPGMLNTLQFVDDLGAVKPLAVDEIEIKVVASALNFVDIMIAMGQVPDTMLGAECSGIVTRIGENITSFKVGDRAMTWGLGYHATFARNPGVMFQQIPDDITFEEAASIPVVYCTSYYAFFDAARLQKGESVLIHSAAGGVGQSAIILAQSIGAEIFATVGSEEKKQLIMGQYGIPEDHIFDSRNLSFGEGIKRMTKGRGVDVVLNSLAGNGLRESWLCLAPYGRFVEIGKKDIVGNTGLEMAPFMHNRTFVSVNILGMYRDNVRLASRVFADVLSLVRRGVARAIKPMTIYDYSQIETAFRTMQSGKNLGKIVLKPNDEDIVSILPSNQSKLHFDKAATYVLAGGLGGLGRSIAKWMINKGAKNIVFLSRSGAKDEKAQKLIEELVSEGANISAYACDVGDEVQLKLVIQEIENGFPPIKGVVQGAMVLQDALFANMSFEDFTAPIGPKINGSWNLHTHLPNDMDFFVMLSSTAGIIGTRGQGNYNAGNTYQDALAHYRASKNLPATSIDLGMILGVGYVAEKDADLGVIDNFKNLGIVGIREEEFLLILATAITGYGKGDTHIPSQIITGLSTGGMVQQSGAFEDPFRLNDAKFTHVGMMGTHSNTTDTNVSGPQLQRLLSEVTNTDGATSIIIEALTARLANSMMVPVEDLDPSKPVNAYGVDSLVAVELRNWIFREIKADMSVFDILSSIPISALSAKIAANSALVKAAIIETE